MKAETTLEVRGKAEVEKDADFMEKVKLNAIFSIIEMLVLGRRKQRLCRALDDEGSGKCSGDVDSDENGSGGHESGGGGGGGGGGS